MLNVQQLYKQFGTTEVLHNVNFTVPTGRCTALLGPNGAGKTTTLRIISGLLQASKGNITVAEMNYSRQHAAQYKQLIGYLPQTPQYYAWMNGEEFLTFVGKIHGLTASAAKAKAAVLLERVGLKLAGRKRLNSYSGGMKQRLGIAQALIHEPRLLILDEPVSALDPIGRIEMMQLLQQLKGETTILYSTHVLHDAEQLCDDVIIMNAGKIALQGPLTQLQNKYKEPVVRISLLPDMGEEEILHLQQHLLALQSSKGSSLFSESRVELAMLYCKMTDEIEAKQKLWQLLSTHRYNVAGVQFEQTSLEQMFMKVVSE